MQQVLERNQKRRLLIVTTVSETLATILKDQPRFLSGFFSVYLATSMDSFYQKVVEQEDIRPHPVQMTRGVNLVGDLISIFGMIKLIRDIRPDLVHSYTPKAGLVAMLAARICNVPVRIHTFTGLIFPTQVGIKKKVLIAMDRLICACATTVVPEGRGVKDDLRKSHITNKSLDLIGNGNIAGVDLEFFSPQAPELHSSAARLKTDLGIDRDAFVFCFVGRLNRDKGLVELLSAFNLLRGNGHLIIAGDVDKSAPIDGQTLESIRNKCDVHWVGFVEDVRTVIMASDVLVLPSYREGFPNSPLQAGALGKPVILSNVNGCNEIVDPGVNGWLVESRDVASLHAAMAEAVALSGSELLKIGLSGRKKIIESFERSTYWAALVDFYRRELKRLV